MTGRPESPPSGTDPRTDPRTDTGTIHASCVAVDGRGLLILGPSGSGKSSLALRLMAHGARLVADDRCLVQPRDGRLIASSPPALSGLIEARGLGILRADPLAEAPLVLAVDLGQSETERLPPRRHLAVHGIALDLALGPLSDHLGVSLLQHLRCGRQA